MTSASKLLLAAVVATVMVAGIVGVAESRRGGKPRECTACVLTVTPNPVPLNSQSVDISGTGFRANEYLVVTLPGACCDVGTTTGASGAFSVPFKRNFDWPSMYFVEVQRNGVKIAGTTFTVAEVYVQARPVGDDNRKPGAQVPELYAAAILYIRRD